MSVFRTAALLILAVAAVAAGVGWVLSAPRPLEGKALAGVAGDAARGEAVFNIGGCASCHAAAEATDDARRLLLGGQRFETAYGTFVAPNITPHAEAGIGAWRELDFLNAMVRGVSPSGKHYYPAFPYASYARMTTQDVADLWAFLRTLPTSDAVQAGNALHFPFSIRRLIGLWKQLYLPSDPEAIVPLDGAAPEVLRGQYLVEGPGHCGECHTARDVLGGTDHSRWLAGAPNLEGDGTVPNITASETGLADWSQRDVASYLETGFTPDYDTAGGAMVAVIRNTSQLTESDRASIAAYLKAIPPR